MVSGIPAVGITQNERFKLRHCPSTGATCRHFITVQEYLNQILSRLPTSHVSHELSLRWKTKVRNHSKELMYNTGKNYFPFITQLFAISIYEHT
jgi:hypothetical protein